MMTRFKGRSSDTYRMKNKPIKEGYKNYAICCSQTGFVFHYIPYGRTSSEQNLITVINTLAGTLPKHGQKKYVIAMDNYFTYPSVIKSLKNMGIAVVGTARVRR